MFIYIASTGNVKIYNFPDPVMFAPFDHDFKNIQLYI